MNESNILHSNCATGWQIVTCYATVMRRPWTFSCCIGWTWFSFYFRLFYSSMCSFLNLITSVLINTSQHPNRLLHYVFENRMIFATSIKYILCSFKVVSFPKILHGFTCSKCGFEAKLCAGDIVMVKLNPSTQQPAEELFQESFTLLLFWLPVCQGCAVLCVKERRKMIRLPNQSTHKFLIYWLNQIT